MQLRPYQNNSVSAASEALLWLTATLIHLSLIMIIYKATNTITKKVYIGQTMISITERKGDHKRKALVQNIKTPFYESIRKYGFDKFKWEIVDKAKSINELNKKEIIWIKHYDSTNRDSGYNIEIGGNNKKHNFLTRKKISMTQKGIRRSDEFIKKQKIINLGKNNSFYGRKHSEETKLKISITKRSQQKKHTKEHIEKCKHIGEKNHRAKLTTNQVILIKIDLKNGERICHLAKKYNSTTGSIKSIKYGISWKHVKI